MLKAYIKFLDKVLPGFIACPALFQIILEFRNELATKLPDPSSQAPSSVIRFDE